MTLVGALRARRERPALETRARAYEAADSDADVARIQLELLNAEWRRLLENVPYWAELRAARALPERFESLEEFVERVPPTTRSVLRDHHGRLHDRSRPPDLVRMTGGSTAQPIQFPAWSEELRHGSPEMWWARSWYGVRPDSRLFLLWGHSHLLGTGVAGWLRARRLELSDRLLGYHRFSAYDLRPEMLRRAADEMSRFRPDYMLGYSVALDLFARANQDKRDQLRRLDLRVVVGTAESFPAPDSVARLEDLFGCLVAMEYGAVETGVIAHTHPDGRYRVFWRSYMVETTGPGSPSAIRVTSLFPRCMPLVRWEIGDEIVPVADPARPRLGIREFERVVGRCNDYVRLTDGAMIHSEAFSHAVRACPGIRGFQVVQSSSGCRIRWTGEAALPDEALAGVLERLARIHPELGQASFERVDRLEQTVAGKTRMVIAE